MQGHLGVSGGILLLLLLPAALAGGGNALLGRNSRSVLKAGLIAAAVCYLGFLLFVLIFFLTVPSDFFQ